ncbi:MAG: hypothetical protein IPI30_14450 [Saprospiraceae bacterium]|nr:hypothetical protein [Candidatus Vicinibacter affinis]
MNKIFINSVDFTEWVLGLDEFTVTVERSDSGWVDQSTSNTIRIIREGCEIFKAFFFGEICTAQDKILEATIKLDCCDTVFTYDIYFKGCAFIDYDCEARVSMIQRSAEKDAFEKLIGSPFWADKYTYVNDAISAGMVHKLSYVKDDGNRVGLGVYLILAPLLTVVKLIVKGLAWLNIVDEDVLDSLETDHWDAWNAANLNPVELLESLKPVFNAEWIISDGVLYFERKDIIDSLRVNLFNIQDSEKDGDIIDIGDVTNKEPNFAYWDGRYKVDASDSQSSQNVPMYSDIVEWNPTNIKARKGKKEVVANFAPAKFTNDINANGFMKFIWYTAELSDSFNNKSRMTHSLVTGQDICSELKLLIVDEKEVITIDGYKFVGVKRRKIKDGPNGNVYEYNWEMWFDKDLPDQELYKRFHYIDDPENQNSRPINYESITIKPSDFCTFTEKLNTYKLNISISHKDFGQGIPEKYEIDFSEQTVKFENIKFKCS